MRSRLHVLAAVSLLVCATALVVGSALAGPPWAPEIGSPPASTGTIVTPDGILGEGVGLATTNDGKGLWVADRRRNELRRFGPDIINESYAIGGSGTSRRRLRRPSDVAVDPWGNLWVADTGNNRLQRLTPTGKPLAVVSVPGVVAVAAGDDGTVWALSPVGNTVTGATSSGSVFASWQVRPPSSPTSLESTFLNNGGSILDATYSVTDITLGPTGNIVVSGAETLRTRIDCSWYREHRAQLVGSLGALFESDPVLEHGYVWEFTQQGLLLSSRRITQLTRLEACWTDWDTNGSVESVSATAGGSLYFTTHDNLYATSLLRLEEPFVFLPRAVYGSAPRRVEASCRGDYLWTAGTVAAKYAAVRGPSACDRRPPGPGLAFGPIVRSPGQGSVQFSIACTIGRCKGTVDVVVDPSCRGCGGSIRTHPPRSIDLAEGKILVVRFPYRQARKASPIGVRVVARVNGRLARTTTPPRGPVSNAALSLNCAAGAKAGVALVSGSVSTTAAGPIPGPVVVSLARSGIPGVTVSLPPDPRTGAFSTSLALPASGSWVARGAVVAGIRVIAQATCAVDITTSTPIPPPVPPPTPPLPPPTPAASTMTVSCHSSGDPATGAVQLTSSGTLTPARSAVTVVVTYSAPGATPIVRSVTTGADGSYADSATAAPGSWTATAGWAGDAATGGSSAAAGCG